MDLDCALRLTEFLLAFAIIQRAIEHLTGPDRLLFAAQGGLGLLLGFGALPVFAVTTLWVLAVVQLHRFNGPYNGGADKMIFLILTCLALTRLVPSIYWQEMAFAYLAVQLVLSYWISGWVKCRNPEWRNGSALRDVFGFSAYPVSRQLRALGDYQRISLVASWAVIVLELAFPLALVAPMALGAALCLTAAFHVANALFFGLNRFVWAWVAAYPSLIWFQERIVLGNG